MKRTGFIAGLIVLVLGCGLAQAQNPQASVQTNPQIIVGPAFVQNYTTAGGTGTITITPSGGQCTYIWEVDAEPFNGTNTTVTNGLVTLTAGNYIRKWAVGVGATAQAMGTGFTYSPAGQPLKTSATSITLTTPTGLANATWNINIDYSFGPC